MSIRRDVRVAQRRQLAADLYLQGKTQAEIALTCNVTQQQISSDLYAIQKRWIKDATLDFNQIKSRELARIDRVEREAWAAYERSKQAFKSHTVKAKGTQGQAQPGAVEQTTRTDERTGDPRWIDKVQWCIEQRLKIFGIYAADKSLNDWRKDVLAMMQTGQVTLDDVRHWRQNLSTIL
jgi:hypothetical protein